MFNRYTRFNSRTATPEELDQYRRIVGGVPTDAEVQSQEHLEGVVYVWTREVRGRSMTTVVAFGGKRTKPDLNIYTYQPQHADARISEFFAGLERAAAYKAERKAAHRNIDMTRYVEGAILHYSFGYDMTINCYYQIVKVKGQSVVIRKIAARTVKGDGGYSGLEAAVADAYIADEPELTKRVTANGVKIGHHHADVWDGRPNYFNYMD